MRNKVILVDDHVALRSGIKNWIEPRSDFKTCIEAGCMADCEEIFKDLAQGKLQAEDFVAVVDISFKEVAANGTLPSHEENAGFSLIKKFLDFGIPSIAFSSHDSGGFVEHATSAAVGAKGFVSKNADEGILLSALKTVANGGTYIQAELVSGLLEVRNIAQTFTKKERLISDALTLYNTNADVAVALGISEKTVVNYLTTLYDKTGVNNKLQFLERMGRI